MKFIIINGPNLGKIELRDSKHYGDLSLSEIEKSVIEFYKEDEFVFHQTNDEKELIGLIEDAQNKYDGIVVNPGGLTHVSVHLSDCFEISKIPIIEVHLSNVNSRENYRKTLITTSKAKGVIAGFKADGYLAAVFLLKRLNRPNK